MHIIYRLSEGNGRKPRPPWFNKEACLRNFLRVFGGVRCRATVALDGVKRPFQDMVVTAATELRWLQDRLDIVALGNRGNSGSFLWALDKACKEAADDEIVYLVEDDYVHRAGAPEVLEDGMKLGFDYVTGYDHPDKYLPEGTPTTLLYRGGKAHWRLTPSTTMTFAATGRTLREDRDFWEESCEGPVPRDHATFRRLAIGGYRTVGSSIPAYSTHAETKWLAPLVDWEAVVRETI
jgi:hypothetical protein